MNVKSKLHYWILELNMKDETHFRILNKMITKTHLDQKNLVRWKPYQSYSVRRPGFLFRSKRNGLSNPSIRNCRCSYGEKFKLLYSEKILFYSEKHFYIQRKIYYIQRNIFIFSVIFLYLKKFSIFREIAYLKKLSTFRESFYIYRNCIYSEECFFIQRKCLYLKKSVFSERT